MYNRQASNTVTYVSSGSEFVGTLTVKKGNLRVDGKIEGSVDVDGDVEVSVDGSIRGHEVRGVNLTVNGIVNANVVADGKLSLSRSARLEGSIVTDALDIAAGASYVGHIVSSNIPELQPSPSTYSGTRLPPPGLPSNETQEDFGILQIKGNLRVDSKIFGTVEAEGDIEVATAGTIQGPEIRAVNITIYGKVYANVVAEGKLILTQTAQLKGDIIASALEMASGATCIGLCCMNNPG
ncbi:MAG: polymer-forming cytoskeletal protein [Cyanobacteria bacterium LVE1205-1]|jgi:cytoskeletal protein CcmA (bactofilin family)